MKNDAPLDDPAIPAEERLYRRLHTDHVVWNPDSSVKKIASNAFQDSNDGSPCSIAIGGLLALEGKAPEDLLAEHEAFGLAEFTAKDARECGFGVMKSPRENEPGHGDLTGDKGPAGPRRRLAKKAILRRVPSREA